MAKLTLADIVSFINDVAAKLTYQQNNDLIEAALENTLSRDGTSPNTMTADIDMNSNKIINNAAPVNDLDLVTKKFVDDKAINLGTGDVIGPASSTDGSIALYDGTTGVLLKEGSLGDGLKDTAGTLSVDLDTVAGLDFNSGKLRQKPEAFIIAVSDETTTITTGTAKITFRMPYAFTLTDIRASLTTVSSSGIPTIGINEGGVSILSTDLTIDASEKTSTTAATPVVISDTTLADDAEMTIDIDVAGTGAKGLKVALIGRPT